MPPAKKRTRTKSSRRSDSLFGYLIPLFMMALAGYQQVTTGTVQLWVIGSVVAFGLAALGWNIDSMFETWVLARERASKKLEENDTEDVEEKDGE